MTNPVTGEGCPSLAMIAAALNDAEGDGRNSSVGDEGQKMLKLEEALEEIAAQDTTAEMHPSAHCEADFEAAYDKCIRVARDGIGLRSKSNAPRRPKHPDSPRAKIFDR